MLRRYVHVVAKHVGNQKHKYFYKIQAGAWLLDASVAKIASRRSDPRLKSLLLLESGKDPRGLKHTK